MGEDTIIFIMVGVIIGVLIMGVLMALLMQPVINDLGSSICEEEYNMSLDYVGWGSTLHCEPKILIKQYDGIEVKINQEED